MPPTQQRRLRLAFTGLLLAGTFVLRAKAQQLPTFDLKQEAFQKLNEAEIRAQAARAEQAHTTNNKARKPTTQTNTNAPHIRELQQYSTLAGAIQPALRKLIAGKDQLTLVWSAIQATAHWEDVVLLTVVGWLLVPAVQLSYEQFVNQAQKQHAPKQTPFQDSRLYLLARHVAHISRIALLIYAVDIVQMICIGLGFDSCKLQRFSPHAFAHVAYTLYASNRVSALKRSALRRHVARNPAAFGRLQIVNRLGDAGIAVVTAIVLLHVLDVKMSVAVQSFLALGGIGALTIGLASHGVLTQLINGLLLISSDRLYEGDVVEFNNGLSGTIERMGWMETVVRGSDEKMIAVPNTEFMKLQVSNLSRVRYSQVKQQLRFKHKDATKLPLLMRSIKEEIRLACPNVIVDGTRPFRAHWTSIEDDHLEVTVDAHFEVKPVGNAYWDNRQRVLQAINRAVKINQVELHIKQPLGMSALL